MTSQAAEQGRLRAEATDERLAGALDEIAAASRGRNGYAAAAAALERAAAVSDDDASRARRLYAAAGDAQLAGLGDRARHLLTTADRLTAIHRAAATDPLKGAARPAAAGRPDTADSSLAFARQPNRCTRALTGTAMDTLLAGDLEGAVEAARCAEQAAGTFASRRPGPVAEVAGPDGAAEIGGTARLIRGAALVLLGSRDQGLPLLQNSPASTAGAGARLAEPQDRILAGYGLSLLGRPGSARTLLARAEAELRAAGALRLLPFALAVGAHAGAHAGRFGPAASTAREAVELSWLTGDEFWRGRAWGVLARIHAVQGNEEECRADAEQAMAHHRPGAAYAPDAAQALSLLALGLGRYGDAAACPEAAGLPDEAGGPAVTEADPDLLEAHLRDGRRPTPQMIARLDRLCDDARFPLRAAAAWRLRGLMAEDAEVGRCFGTALDLLDQAENPFETGRTRLAFAERLRRDGRRVLAREQLQPALELFEFLGARPWIRRARNELAATGAVARKLAAASAADALTPQEFQVARAVATGLTNRETAGALFLSPKTVEYHLGNVYRKLGVRSRGQLAHRFPGLATD